jgi:hypothetical protein
MMRATRESFGHAGSTPSEASSQSLVSLGVQRMHRPSPHFFIVIANTRKHSATLHA